MLEHGGNLNEAARHYGRPRSEWLDLSTGINPRPYPAPVPSPDAWHRLPYAGTLMIYGFRDTAVNPASVWDNMGLVRRDFSAKLAYNAFQTAAMGAPAGPRQERPCIGSSPIGSKGGRRQRSC